MRGDKGERGEEARERRGGRVATSLITAVRYGSLAISSYVTIPLGAEPTT